MKLVEQLWYKLQTQQEKQQQRQQTKITLLTHLLLVVVR